MICFLHHKNASVIIVTTSVDNILWSASANVVWFDCGLTQKSSIFQVERSKKIEDNLKYQIYQSPIAENVWFIKRCFVVISINLQSKIAKQMNIGISDISNKKAESARVWNEKILLVKSPPLKVIERHYQIFIFNYVHNLHNYFLELKNEVDYCNFIHMLYF